MRLCDSFDHVFLEHLSNNTVKLRNPDSDNAEEEKRVGEVAGQWLKENATELQKYESDFSYLKDFYGATSPVEVVV